MRARSMTAAVSASAPRASRSALARYAPDVNVEMLGNKHPDFAHVQAFRTRHPWSAPQATEDHDKRPGFIERGIRPSNSNARSDASLGLAAQRLDRYKLSLTDAEIREAPRDRRAHETGHRSAFQPTTTLQLVSAVRRQGPTEHPKLPIMIMKRP